MYTNVFLPIRKCNHTPIDVFHDSNTPIELFLTSTSCIQLPNKSLLTCYLPCQKMQFHIYKRKTSIYKRKLVLLPVWTYHLSLYKKKHSPIEVFLTFTSCIQPLNKSLLTCYLPCQNMQFHI